ncbi:hypothetical protein GCM10009623_34210 [Nocardioides aestuarii]|uniref:DUF5994 family protein n=1 Tax=Nocardioides aestuarii TaxID=252231 RepID=A0ABW4TSX3_9ACTN
MSPPVPRTTPHLMPVRLLLAAGCEDRELDGAWWPHGSDLELELAGLVQHFPAQRSRIVLVSVSRPDWAPFPRRAGLEGEHVGVAASDGDPHVVGLTLADGSRLRLLVVPPDLPLDLAEGAMFTSTQPGNTTVAGDLLQRAQAPDEQWHDHEEPWWGHAVPPSHRSSH